LLITAFSFVGSARSDTILQSINSAGSSSAWEDAIWGSPAALPEAAHDYVSKTGFFSASATKLGVNVTGRVRSYGGTFGGTSLKIVSGTELLLKPGTHAADLSLESGAIVRLAPDTVGNATLGGAFGISGSAYLGVVSVGTSELTVNSTLGGHGTLNLRAGDGTGNSLSVGGSLSGLTGTIVIGGGANLLNVRLSQDYNLPDVDLRMGDHSTRDRLILSRNLTFKSFTFGGDGLAPGTYSAASLNYTFGTGGQFVDEGGTLTVLEAVADPVSIVSRLFMIGDSTVADWPSSEQERGWGEKIHHYFKRGVRCVDHAVPGDSTKTFINEGTWAKTLAALGANDYLFIQFGHNDSHDPSLPESTNAGTDYKAYLQQYIDEARAKGAIPVLVTPMYRRSFDSNGVLLSYIPVNGQPTNDLAPYAAAMREVALANSVALIDLFNASGVYMQKLGDTLCKTLLVTNDPTHWNDLGATAMACLVANEFFRAAPVSPDAVKELSQYLRRDFVGIHVSDLAAGAFPRPLCGLERDGEKLRLNWLLQPAASRLQRSMDLVNWAEDPSGSGGTDGTLPVDDGAPNGFFRLTSP
jgi:lysophospholipase L1-like esterase